MRGLRPSKQGESTIRRRLGLLASRMVARGAMFEQRERLAQLGRDVDLSVAEAATAAFDSPADFLAIKAETEATLARFTNKLPPDILAAKGTAAREMIAANAAAGLIELDPALAIEGLKGEFFGDSLPAVERKRLRARAKAAVSDRRAQAERGQSRERVAAAADGARRLVVLEGAIGRGEAGERAIAEAADILDDPTRARLREILDARRAEDAARDRRIEKVSAVLAGRAPATGDGDGKPDGGGVKAEALRPGAPEWRQAVDDHYASLADTLETMNPDTRARFEDDYARTTGVLPGAIAKTIRAGLLSADPGAQAAAATRLARLKDGNPALVSTIPANERRRAGAIAEFADLGLPPARVVELAEEKLAHLVLPTEDLTGGAGGHTLPGGIQDGKKVRSPLIGPGGKGRGEDNTAADEEPEPTAGAEEQAAPDATRGERPDQSRRSVKDLRRLYRDRKIPDDIAGILAKTGVVPQVVPKLDGKKVELIRAVRDLDPKDEKAVKALRKRIRRELGRSPGFHDAFQLEVTARIAGRKRDVSVRQLARFAVIEFGREIDPENAELLAAVLEATPENLKDVLGRINRRFDGLSGGSVAYKHMLSAVIQFKQTGGKRGLSPKAAAGRLMPYVDGRIAEANRKVAKTAIGAVALGPGLILKLIRIINSGDSVLSLSGTKRQRESAIERIGGK